MMQRQRADVARCGEANRRDETGGHAYHYSLTQRVFVVFARMARPLDRSDVMALLNIGDEGLKHAMSRLVALGAIAPTEGRYGFYELAPGATLPEDARGRNSRSRTNLKRGRGGPERIAA